MISAAPSVTGETLIPDLLRTAPQVRPILDRYGLRGCGGRHGPHETIGFFARAHDLRVEQLLRELNGKLETEDGETGRRETMARAEFLGDSIYRSFFKTAIALVLTVGAVWGAMLLARIALAGNFTAVSIREINAHGHAQIFGWVGLFVMGFAYQAFPRFKHTVLSHPKLARATLWMMVTGIVVRCLFEPMLGAWPAVRPLAIMAGPIEIAAVALFIYIIVSTWRESGKPMEVHDWFIACGLFWFFFQTTYESVYFAATASAETREELLKLLSVWQAPLRDFQIHGFALLMILGVSQRIFPHFYGMRKPSPRLAIAVLIVLNASVIAEAVGLIMMRTAGHAWAALWYTGVLGLLIGAVLLVRDWKIFSRCEEGDRSLKFLRTAYVWLFLSLTMLALLPVHQFGLLKAFAPESAAAQMGFSHAYYGAIRHAITVGFVSMMIVGVSAKVVPTLRGYNIHSLSPLWGVFLLLNAGCATRVVGQTLTDFTATAFPFAGVSGCMEVAALAFWGGHLWHLMHTAPLDAPHLNDVDGDKTERFTGAETVGTVLRSRPDLLASFVDHGFHLLANPMARSVLAGQVTIRQACRRMDVDLDSFLKVLNHQAVPGGRAAVDREDADYDSQSGKEVVSCR